MVFCQVIRIHLNRFHDATEKVLLVFGGQPLQKPPEVMKVFK